MLLFQTWREEITVKMLRCKIIIGVFILFMMPVLPAYRQRTTYNGIGCGGNFMDDYA